MSQGLDLWLVECNDVFLASLGGPYKQRFNLFFLAGWRTEFQGNGMTVSTVVARNANHSSSREQNKDHVRIHVLWVYRRD